MAAGLSAHTSLHMTSLQPADAATLPASEAAPSLHTSLHMTSLQPADAAALPASEAAPPPLMRKSTRKPFLGSAARLREANVGRDRNASSVASWVSTRIGRSQTRASSAGGSFQDFDERRASVTLSDLRGVSIYEESSSDSEASRTEASADSVAIGTAHAAGGAPSALERRGSVESELITSTITESDAICSVPVLIKEWCYHVFFPLSLPILWAVDGVIYAANHSWAGRAIYFDFTLSLVMLTMNIIFFGWLQGVDTRVTPTEIILADIVYLFHKVMVATKVCPFVRSFPSSFFNNSPHLRSPFHSPCATSNFCGCILSMQYSFLGAALIEEMHHVELSREQRQERELISGWLQISDSACAHELESTGFRMGIDLKKIFFHFHNSKAEVEAQYASARTVIDADMPPPSSSDSDSSDSVAAALPIVEKSSLSAELQQTSAHDMLLFIIMQVFSRKRKLVTRLFAVGFAFALLLCLIPTLSRLSCDIAPAAASIASNSTIPAPAPAGASGKNILACLPTPAPTYPALDQITIFASLMTGTFFTMVSFVFIGIGIVDYLRRARLLALLQVMIDPAPLAPHLKSDTAFARIPANLLFLDLSIGENVISWFVVRQAIQNFGIAFRRRITYYSVYLFVLNVCLLLILAASLISRGSQTAALNLDQLTLLYVVSVSLTLTLVWLSIMVYFGSKGNTSYWLHRGTLSRIQMALRENIAKTDLINSRSSAAANFLVRNQENSASVDALLESVMAMLRIEEQVDPVTVVGLVASPELLSVFISVVTALVTVGIRLLTGVN